MGVFSALDNVQNAYNRKGGDKYLDEVVLPSEIKGYYFNIWLCERGYEILFQIYCGSRTWTVGEAPLLPTV